MLRNFLENKMVDIRESLIMSSLQGDMISCVNRVDKYEGNVSNMTPLFLFLMRELKEDLCHLNERVSILEKGTKERENNAFAERKRVSKGMSKAVKVKSAKNNRESLFKEKEEWLRKKGIALEKIREIYMQLAKLNTELDSLC